MHRINSQQVAKMGVSRTNTIIFTVVSVHMFVRYLLVSLVPVCPHAWHGALVEVREPLLQVMVLR